MARITPLALAILLAAFAVHAQHTMPPGLAGSPAESDAEANLRPRNSEKLDDYLDRAHLTRGRDPAKVRTEATEASARLIAAMRLPCDIADAGPVGRGTATLDGKKSQMSIFEVACRNRLGFILVAREAAAPYATSCFSAEAARAAAAAAGRTTDMYCELPENKDVNAMATALMGIAGAPCTVRKSAWFGRNLSANTELTEVVCSDSRGYLLQTAQAGSAAAPSAMTCRDAAQQRIKCRLTDGGPLAAAPTADTFKAFLGQKEPECKVDRIRIIGQEAKHDRYLIEASCSAHPRGLIALIPLNDNPAPYEAMDCEEAQERGVHCELIGK